MNTIVKVIPGMWFLMAMSLLLLTTCQRKNIQPKTTTDGLLDITTNALNIKCEEFILDGIDSKVGKITCANDTFSYDMGRFGYKGPISLKDNFEKTFYNYHYSAFFRKLGMDEKVFKSLRSKTMIDSVSFKEKFTGKLMFECDPCNAVAKIIFENTPFYYPYTDSPGVIKSTKEFDFDYLEEKGVRYKWYQPVKGKGEYGMFITFDHEDFLEKNISILITHSSDYQKSFQWLKELRMKENFHQLIHLK